MSMKGWRKLEDHEVMVKGDIWFCATRAGYDRVNTDDNPEQFVSIRRLISGHETVGKRLSVSHRNAGWQIWRKIDGKGSISVNFSRPLALP
jgi:hypothetical protein